ncbi:MAG: MBL fold metallo-hydrolase, partial [Chloroflexota bacterium]|nr:MBL fold metallo-hydrolase [Chloroflexota bacterium]
MSNHVVNVGNVELISLNDNLPVRSPFVAFPHTTIEEWNEYPELMHDHENGKHRWGALAIRSSGKLIVVDTGMQGEGCYLLDDMRNKGIDPEAVNLVVFTHVHPDHVGWNYTDGKPNFPNARFLVPRKDWDYWTQPDIINTVEYVVPQVLPLKEEGVMDLIDGEYEITPELT